MVTGARDFWGLSEGRPIQSPHIPTRKGYRGPIVTWIPMGIQRDLYRATPTVTGAPRLLRPIQSPYIPTGKDHRGPIVTQTLTSIEKLLCGKYFLCFT